MEIPYSSNEVFKNCMKIYFIYQLRVQCCLKLVILLSTVHQNTCSSLYTFVHIQCFQDIHKLVLFSNNLLRLYSKSKKTVIFYFFYSGYQNFDDINTEVCFKVLLYVYSNNINIDK